MELRHVGVHLVKPISGEIIIGMIQVHEVKEQNQGQAWDYHFLRWWLFCCELQRVSHSFAQYEAMQEQDIYDTSARHFLIQTQGENVGVFRLLSWGSYTNSLVCKRYELLPEYVWIKESPCLEISRLALVPHERGCLSVLHEVANVMCQLVLDEQGQCSENGISKKVVVAVEPRFAKLIQMLGYRVKRISKVNDTIQPPKAVYWLGLKEI